MAPGSLGLFFSDSLLAAQHRVYLRVIPACVKQISNKEGSSTEENGREEIPTRANTGSCISDHISRDSLWKHPEILGINGGSVWPPPFGSVLAPLAHSPAASMFTVFSYYFSFCKPVSEYVITNNSVKIPGGRE